MDNKLQSYYQQQQAKPKAIVGSNPTIKVTNTNTKEFKALKHKHDLSELLFGEDVPEVPSTQLSPSTPLTSRSDPFPLTAAPAYGTANNATTSSLLLLDTFYDNLLRQHAAEQAAAAAAKHQKQKTSHSPTSTSPSFHFNIDKLSAINSITPPPPPSVRHPEVVRCPTVIKGRTVVVPHNNNTMGNGSLAGCKLGTTGHDGTQPVHVIGASNGYQATHTKVKSPYLTIRRSTEK